MNTAQNFFNVNKNLNDNNNKSNNNYNNTSIVNINPKNNNNNLFAFQEQCAKEYERIIKTSHQNRSSKNIICSREVNYKMLESDIFSLKNTDEEKKNFYKEKKNLPIVLNNKKDLNPLDSDIFLQKNNEKSIGKIGERSLLMNRDIKNYHPSQKSNSEWNPKKIDFKSYVNHHSCEYDIIKPDVYNKIYTKNYLFNEANGNNPAKKQKGLSEFNDLARVGIPNPNKEFVGAFKQNEKIFLKNENMCNDHIHLFRTYENLIRKPFHKGYV